MEERKDTKPVSSSQQQQQQQQQCVTNARACFHALCAVPSQCVLVWVNVTLTGLVANPPER